MPRYSDVDTITFIDVNGNQFPVKDIRPISEQTVAFEIDKTGNDLLDEVASRKLTFGDFGEIQSWRFFDLNIVRLTEVNFDMTKLKRLKVPL